MTKTKFIVGLAMFHTIDAGIVIRISRSSGDISNRYYKISSDIDKAFHRYERFSAMRKTLDMKVLSMYLTESIRFLNQDKDEEDES